MKIYKFLLPCCLLLATACTENFEAINANTDQPQAVAPQFLLTHVLYTAADQNAREAWLGGNFLAQYTSNIQFLPIDRYELGTNTELWNTYFLLLQDISSIIRLSETGNPLYKGVALVMKAFITSQLTDLWGDIPYSQALQGRENQQFTPSYDTQQQVYTGADGILATLDEALSVLEAHRDYPATIEGDIIYQGDINRWIRFAHALQIRYMLRISEQDPALASQRLQNIISQGNLMQSNRDNAAVPYLAVGSSQWFIFNEREGRYTDVRMSTTIEQTLKAFDDPRIGLYFKPTPASQGTETPEYQGLPNGLSLESSGNIDLSGVSTMGSILRDAPNAIQAFIMHYSEQQFALAEAVQRGLVTGDARTYYEDGVRASFAQYGLEMPAGYLLSAGVVWNEREALKLILTQQWLSLFMVGYEGWFNIRRTGIPALPIPQDNLNNGVFPVRFRYPDTEKSTNTLQYQEAVQRMGEDSYNIKGWWEGE